MKVVATPEAEEAVRRVAASGRRDLVMVLGTGCCDSTAPFLYDHYVVEPDAVRVGEAAGVSVFAHAWLAKLYQGERTLEIGVDRVVNDSLSLESDHDLRFTLHVPDAARA
jgi:uncharacterized protein (DUF779 family)